MPGGENDKMVKDVRTRLRNIATKGGKYFKGTAGLFLASGTEMLNVQMPFLSGMLETNRDILSDTVKFLRNPADAINRTVDKALKSEDYQALQKFAKNALSDLQSGDLYDPNRMRSEFGEGIDSLLDNFGDFDMSGFDDQGEYTEPTGDDNFDKEVALAEAQEESADAREVATLDAIGAATNAVVGTENANAQMNIRLSMKQHSQLMAGLQNVVTEQAATLQAVNQTAVSILDVMREAHNQVTSNMETITGLLTKIEVNTAPKVPEKDKVRETPEIFGSHGELDIREWLKQVRKNADEKYGISSAIGMVTGGQSIKQLLENTYGDNPWQIVSDLLLNKIVPENLKTQMSRTNANLSSFGSALLNKLAERGKRFGSGDEKDATIGNFIAGLLGVEQRSKSSVSADTKNLSAPMELTKRTLQAIEQVIPMWLSRIYSALSGEQLGIYNYGSGKFETVASTIYDVQHSANDLVSRMGTSASKFVDMASETPFESVAMQNKFKEYLYTWLQDQADKSRFIDPWQDFKTFKENMPTIDGEIGEYDRDLFAKAIMSTLRTMDRQDLMRLPQEMFEARQARDRANTSVNAKHREDGTTIAFAGGLDKKFQDRVVRLAKTTAGQSASDLTEEYDKHVEKQVATGKGILSTNAMLSDIKSMLARGIITYTYIMGNSDPNNVPTPKGKRRRHGGPTPPPPPPPRPEGFDDAQKVANEERERLAKIRNAENRAKTNKEEYKARAQKEHAKEHAEGKTQFGPGTDLMAMEEYHKRYRATHDAHTDVAAIELLRRDIDEHENPDKAKEITAKKMADLSKSMGDKLERTGFKGLLDNVKDFSKTPFKLMEDGLKVVDSFLFRIIYGEDASQVLLDENKLPSLLETVRINMKASWLEMRDWFGEHIGKPLEDALFNKETGILSRVAKTFEEKIGAPIKEKANEVKEKLIGKREIGPDGKPVGPYTGGKFSDAINRLTDKAKDLKEGITGKTQGPISEFLFGKYAKGHGVERGFREVKTGEIGKIGEEVDKKETIKARAEGRIGPGEFIMKDVMGETTKMVDEINYDGFIGNLRKTLDNGISSLKGMLFGPDDKGDTHGSWEKWNLVKKEVNEAFPDMVIGSGIGLLGSFFLPGGPVLGALLGATGGLVAGSTSLKKFLFGEFGDEEVEEQYYDAETHTMKTRKRKKRTGGLIDDEITEGFKKFAPKIGIGAGIGVIGSMFLPGGPLIGGLIGSIGGMTAASEQMKRLIFGELQYDKDGNVIESSKSDGLISANVRKAIEEGIGPTLGGAALGAGSWGLISSLGIIPGLSLLPGGPIFGMIGGLMGAMNKDAINNFFFGEEQEVEETQPDGSVKKVKKKVGGLFGRAFDFTRDKIMKPFADRINAAGHKIGEWFQASVVMPFSNAIEPIKSSIANAGQAIKASMENIGNKIKESFDNIFEKFVGQPMGDFFKEKILGPLDRAVSKIFNGIGKLIGAIVSAPFKALEFIFTGTIGGKTPEELSEDRKAAKKAKEAEKDKKRHEKTGNRLKDIIDGTAKRITNIFTGGEKKPKEKKGESKEGEEKKESIFSRAKNFVQEKAEAHKKRKEEKAEERRKRKEQKSEEREKIKEQKPASTPEVNRIENAESQAAKDSKEKAKRDDASSDERNKLVENAEKASEKNQSKSESDGDKNANKAEAKEAKPGFKARKSNNEYLRMIEGNTRKIYNEIKGQLGGSGWNIAYIKTLLDKHFGKLSADELPEEMEGSKKVKKRRGFFGRIADRIEGAFTVVRDKISDLVGGLVGAITFPFRMLGKAVGFLKDAVVGVAGTVWGVLKSLGTVAAEILKGAAKGLGMALAGVGKMLWNAAGGIGKALGSIVGTLGSVLGDVVKSLSALTRGVIETVATLAPDIAATAWKGMKFVAGGMWKGVKFLGKGILDALKFGKDMIGGGIKWLADRVHLPKIELGWVGNFPVAVGGDRNKPFPYVSMAVAGDSGVFSPLAIPVYLQGASDASTFYVKMRDGDNTPEENKPVTETPGDLNVPSDEGSDYIPTDNEGGTGGGTRPYPYVTMMYNGDSSPFSSIALPVFVQGFCDAATLWVKFRKDSGNEDNGDNKEPPPVPGTNEPMSGPEVKPPEIPGMQSPESDASDTEGPEGAPEEGASGQKKEKKRFKLLRGIGNLGAKAGQAIADGARSVSERIFGTKSVPAEQVPAAPTASGTPAAASPLPEVPVPPPVQSDAQQTQQSAVQEMINLLTGNDKEKKAEEARESRKQTEKIKRQYDMIDRSSETSSTPGEVYDKAVRNSTNLADIEAIKTVEQLNGGKATVTTGEAKPKEEKKGIIDSIIDAVTGGSGGIGSMIKNLIPGLLAGAASLFHFTSDNGNKSWGANIGLHTILKGLNLNKLSPKQIIDAFLNPNNVDELAEGLTKSQTKGLRLASTVGKGVKGFKNGVSKVSGFLDDAAKGARGLYDDFMKLVLDPANADAAIELGKDATSGSLFERLKMLTSGYAAKGVNALKTGVQKVGSKVTGFADDVGKGIMNTPLVQKITGAVSKVGSSLKGSADDIMRVAAGTADDAVKLGPVKNAIAKVIKSFMSNKAVQKAFGALKSKIPGLMSKLTGLLSGEVLEKAMQSGAANTLKNAGRQIAAFSTGGLLAVGFAVYDFISGMGNASKYFHVFGSDITLGMRLTAGICNCLGGLLGLIPMVGPLLSIAVSIFMDKIVQLVYGVLADDADKQELAQNQAELQSATDAYNAQNGTSLTVDEYSQQFNADGTERKSIFQKIGGGFKSIASKVGSGLSAIGGGIVNGVKTVGGGILTGAKAIGGGVLDSFKNIGGNIVSGAKSLFSGDIMGGLKDLGGAAATIFVPGVGLVKAAGNVVERLKSVGGPVGDAATWVSDKVGGLVTGAKTAVGNFMTNAGDALSNATKVIGEKLSPVKDTIGTFMQDPLGNVRTLFAETIPFAIGKGVGTVAEGFKSFWKDAGTFVENAKASISTTVSNMVEGFNNWKADVGETISGMVTKFGEWKDKIGEFMSNFPDNVVNKAKEVITNIGDKFEQFKENAAEGFSNFVENTKAKVSEITSNLATGFNNFKENVISTASSMWSGVVSGFNNAKTAVGSFFASIPEKASNLAQSASEYIGTAIDSAKKTLSEIPEKIKEAAGNAWESVKETAGNAWSGIKDTAGNVWDGVTGFFSDVGENFTKGFESATGKGPVVETAKSGVNDAILAVKDIASKLATSIKGAISPVIGNLGEQFKTMFPTLSEGLEKIIGTVKSSVKTTFDAVKSGGEKITDTLGSVLGISGDSKADKREGLATALLSVGKGLGSMLIDTMRSITSSRDGVSPLMASIGEGFGAKIIGEDTSDKTKSKPSTARTGASNIVSAIGSGIATAITGNTVAPSDISTTPTTTSSSSSTKMPWYQKILPWNWGKGPEENVDFDKIEKGSADWGKGPIKPMKQSDPKWTAKDKNMAMTGCGPTVAAMVASKYDSKANPSEANTMSKQLGMRASDGGTNPRFFSSYASSHGYKMREGPVDDKSIKSALSQDRPVVVMGKGGAFGGNTHYMVADRMNSKKNVGLIDPITGGHKSTSLSSLMDKTSTAVYSWGKGSDEDPSTPMKECKPCIDLGKGPEDFSKMDFGKTATQTITTQAPKLDMPKTEWGKGEKVADGAWNPIAEAPMSILSQMGKGPAPSAMETTMTPTQQTPTATDKAKQIASGTVSSLAESAVKDYAVNGATKSTIIKSTLTPDYHTIKHMKNSSNKIVSTVGNLLNKFFNNSGVQRFFFNCNISIGKIRGTIMKLVTDRIIPAMSSSSIGRGVLNGLRNVGRFLTGGGLDIIFAVGNFIAGYNNTAEYFGVPEGEATLGMKLTSGICGAIGSLLQMVDTVLPGVGTALSVAASVCMPEIVTTVYSILSAAKEKVTSMISNYTSSSASSTATLPLAASSYGKGPKAVPFGADQQQEESSFEESSEKKAEAKQPGYSSGGTKEWGKGPGTQYPQYQLSEDMKVKIAKMLARETGGHDIVAARNNLSHLANLNEVQQKRDVSEAGLKKTLESGWYGSNPYSPGENWSDTAASTGAQAVNEILVQGHRTLPRYVTEYDMFPLDAAKDGTWKTKGQDRTTYIPHQTQIVQNPNRFSSPAKYTFYKFIGKDGSGDVMGYYSQYYDKYQSDTAWSDTDASIAAPSSAASPGAGTTTNETVKPGYTLPSNVEILNNFPYFNQGDPKWATKMYSSKGDPEQTMKSSACGPTSMSMIMQSYGVNIDPPTAADWSVAHGHRTSNDGTSWSFFGDIGNANNLSVKNITYSSMRDTLARGIPIVASMKKGHFTKGGHFIDLVGLKGDKVLVNDPASRDRTKQTWDQEVFANEATNFWAVTDKAGAGSINNTHQAAPLQEGGNPLSKPYKVTSPFGNRNLSGSNEFHHGVDLVPTDGSRQADVGFRYSGTIESVKKDLPDSHTGLGVTSNKAGNNVVLKADNGLKVKYMHLKAGSIPDNIVKGAHVNVGDLVGKMGTTGRSTGPHLHYQIEKSPYGSSNAVDPAAYIEGGANLSGFTTGSGNYDAGASNYSSNEATPTGTAVSGDSTDGATDFISKLFSLITSKFTTLLYNRFGIPASDDSSSGTTSGGTTTSSTYTTSGASSGGAVPPSGNYSAVQVPTDISGNSNIEKIYSFLRNEGYSPEAAAGLMGCWQNESGNTPKKVEADFLGSFSSKGWTYDKIFASNDAMDKYVEEFMLPAYDKTYKPYSPNQGTAAELGMKKDDPRVHDIAKINEAGYRFNGHWYPGIGLAGWTGSRTVDLTNFANAKGIPWGDLTTQLAYFKYDTTEGKYKGYREKANAAKTPEQGAQIALDNYEMYQGWSQTEKGREQLAARAASAAQIYAQMKDYKPTDPSTANPDGTPIAYGGEDDGFTTETNTMDKGGNVAWGKGPSAPDLSANIVALNEEIQRISQDITDAQTQAQSEATVSTVTNKITDAIGNTDGTVDNKLMSAMVQMMGEMVEHLAAIRKNTEQAATTSEGTQKRDRSPARNPMKASPTYPNDQESPDDIGASVIRRLTSI